MNWYGVRAIYGFEMARMRRTIFQSIVSPVMPPLTRKATTSPPDLKRSMLPSYEAMRIVPLARSIETTGGAAGSNESAEPSEKPEMSMPSGS